MTKKKAREEAIRQLIKLQKDGDTETAHARADKVLCDLLIVLGYKDVVANYELVDKWYA